MARIYQPAAIDGEVRVELENDVWLKGSVAWVNEWDFGIAFAEPIDVEAILAGSSSSGQRENRRAFPRTMLNCPAQLRLPSRILRARAKDISPEGARVETLRPIPCGTRITLTLPDLPPMSGTVRWSSDNFAGLRFDEALPARVLTEWLRQREE